MKRPTEPTKEDCCNSGCNPCIFDVYEKQLKLYEECLTKNVILKNSTNRILPLEYTTYVVVANINICDSHNLIVFKIETPKENSHIWWNPGDHFLYKYSGDDKQCTRAYTPLIVNNVLNKDQEFDFMIIVKNYKNNSISSQLCSIEIGCKTSWRGPYGSYNLMINKYKRMFLIAQGTGIAPFYSIIKKILGNEDDFTNLLLIYCCQNIHTILLREEFYNFNSYWNFSYRIFVSEKIDKDKIKYREPIMSKRLTIEEIKDFKPFLSNDQVLICGSPEFITTFRSQLNIEGIPIDNIVLF